MGLSQGLDDWIAEINQWCADQLWNQQIDFLLNLPGA